MLFTEEFLAEVSADPINGVLDICRLVKQRLSEDPEGWTEQDHEVLLEAFALLSSLEDARLIQTEAFIPDIKGELGRDCGVMFEYINSLENQYKAEASILKFKSYKSRFRTNLTNSFCYEFSQGDLDRIQTLINELREHISSSSKFEEDHKRRLLSKLEKLQAELHKKMSNLDMVYGLVGETGVVLGKFGNDVKPIVDRLRELVQIVWRTQARAEELPSDSPLPKLEEKSDETEIV